MLGLVRQLMLLGVPGSYWLGQHLGWRDVFVVVAIIDLATVARRFQFVAGVDGIRPSRPGTEFGALRRSQVLLTLVVGAVGFGGMFAVYTYITTTLTDVAGMESGCADGAEAVAAGHVAGISWWCAADRGVDKAIFVALLAMVVISRFCCGGAQSVYRGDRSLHRRSGRGARTGLQTRLMDVAHDAQTLAAALNHAALNIANAAGAWLVESSSRPVTAVPRRRWSVRDWRCSAPCFSPRTWQLHVDSKLIVTLIHDRPIACARPSG